MQEGRVTALTEAKISLDSANNDWARAYEAHAAALNAYNKVEAHLHKCKAALDKARTKQRNAWTRYLGVSRGS